MSNSSTKTPPNMNENGTMIGVPTPGGNEKYAPKGGVKMLHGENVTGGNQSIKAKPTSNSKGSWGEPGGSQVVKRG